MKAAAFEYVRVASVEDACRALAAADGAAEHKIIAGPYISIYYEDRQNE